MTKEQIEKAVNDYIGYEPEVDEGLGTRMRRDAFRDGAEWRINSVWHDAEEEPKQNAWFIAQMKLYRKDEKSLFDTFIRRSDDSHYWNDWKNWRKGFNIKRWAYIDDLLPERKEETE